MSRTKRKKHHHDSAALIKIEFEERCNEHPDGWDLYRIAMGRMTLEGVQERNVRDAKRWLKRVTTDNGSKGWVPWSQSLKQTNARRSRNHMRQELSNVYRDWEYDVVNIKYNRYDNVWNWD